MKTEKKNKQDKGPNIKMNALKHKDSNWIRHWKEAKQEEKSRPETLKSKSRQLHGIKRTPLHCQSEQFMMINVTLIFMCWILYYQNIQSKTVRM